MEDDAGKHASSVLYINPGCNKAHWSNGNQEVYHVKHIHFPDFVVIGSRNPEQRKMPGSPHKAEDD